MGYYIYRRVRSDGISVPSAEISVMFLQLKSESTVDARDRVVRVEVDVNLWVPSGWKSAAVASNHPLSFHHGHWNLLDHVNRPVLVHLLLIHILVSHRSHVIFAPRLACVSLLIIESQSRACKRSCDSWWGCFQATCRRRLTAATPESSSNQTCHHETPWNTKTFKKFLDFSKNVKFCFELRLFW